MFFTTWTSKRVFVKLDLSRDRSDEIDININGEVLHQKVVCIGLPNTCFRCESSAHKICDCLLMVGRFNDKPDTTSPLASLVEGVRN